MSVLHLLDRRSSQGSNSFHLVCWRLHPSTCEQPAMQAPRRCPSSRAHPHCDVRPRPSPRLTDTRSPAWEGSICGFLLQIWSDDLSVWTRFRSASHDREVLARLSFGSNDLPGVERQVTSPSKASRLAHRWHRRNHAGRAAQNRDDEPVAPQQAQRRHDEPLPQPAYFAGHLKPYASTSRTDARLELCTLRSENQGLEARIQG